VLTTACAPLPVVPVEERSVLTVREQSEKIGGQLIRIAQPGDTLHGIAFIAGLDVNRVAAWNGIDDASKLAVGQRVRLTKPIGFVMPKPKSQRVQTSPLVVKDLETPTAATIEPKPRNTKAPNRSQKKSNTGKKIHPSQINKFAWSWPVIGSVIRRFNLASGQQGIDIMSAIGQTVRAAAPGEVVYVGNSLKGYGNLIIVKHNEVFLSAYAHNQEILVEEGQILAPQQAIAKSGLNNRRETALHFQVRKNGRPINPLSYLPVK